VKSSLIEKSIEIQTLIRSISKNFKDYIHNFFKEINLTVPQIILIKELYFNPDISLHELSKRLGLSNSTVSGIVSRLVKQNIIIREIPENNRRIVKLKLSKEAKEKADKTSSLASQYLFDIIKNEDADKIEKLTDSLHYLNNLLIKNKEEK
jgi:MarR family transcriptional regulator, organic hydroperoxide resistance regulator